MTDDELFENWARWVKDRWFQPSMCYSIESRYRSPQTWHPPEARPPEVDRNSAIAVEKQVSYLKRSINKSLNGYGHILVGHYVKRSKPEAVCRKARIRMSEYNAVLKMAQLTVKNRMKT